MSMHLNQCDQIGRFFKVRYDKFSRKTNPNAYLLFGQIVKQNILVKTAIGIVWATFRKILATFYFTIWSHWILNLLLKIWRVSNIQFKIKNINQPEKNFLKTSILELLSKGRRRTGLAQWTLIISWSDPPLPITETTHLLRKGKYHCMVDLLFNCFGFSYYAYV